MADAEIKITIKTDPAKPLNLLIKQANDAEKSVDGLSGAFVKVAGAIGGLAALKGTFDFVLNATREMEDLTTQFIAFTGSADGAKKQLEALSEFASSSPFQLAEIATANRTLLAFGSSTKQSLEQLRQLGEVSAATGTDLSELAVIFGQIQAEGKLTGERFNQLVERGINIGPLLAESLGVAQSALKDLRADGKISADEVAKAFQKMTSEGGQFFGSTERLSKTVSGSLSTLTDNITILAAAVGSSAVPAFSSLVNIISKAVEGNIAYLKEQQKIANENEAQKRIRGIGEELTKLTDKLNGLKKTQSEGFKFFGDDQLQLVDKIDTITLSITRLSQERLKLLKSEGIAESLAKDTEAAAENQKKQDKEREAALEKRRQQLADEQAEQDKAAKATADKVLALQQQITQIELQESSIRNQLSIEQDKANNEIAVQVLMEREAELTSQRIQAEATRQELLLAYDQAEILRADDKQKKLTAIAQKGERDRLAAIRKAQDEEFNLETQTQTARKKFDEQTYAQRVQTAQTGLNALGNLMKSSNREAFEIGKAAATAQALISIPVTAIEAYKSLAGIPVVGPVLGIAAAAAATAAGLANLRQIQATKLPAFAEGGVVPGVGNKDTVPALLTPGEVVVPKKNFADLEAGFVQGAIANDQIILMRQSNDLQARILESVTFGAVVEKLTTIIAKLDQINLTQAASSQQPFDTTTIEPMITEIAQNQPRAISPVRSERREIQNSKNDVRLF